MKKTAQKNVPAKIRKKTVKKAIKKQSVTKKKSPVGAQWIPLARQQEAHILVAYEQTRSQKIWSVFRVIGKILLYSFGSIFALALLVFGYINLPVSSSGSSVAMGTTFSARYASDIGLDWRQAYLAMLDELNMKHIRIPVYWDLVEKEEGVYDFSDLDWQLEKARQKDAKIILAIGRKVPRWPECFIPAWTGEDTAVQKEKLLRFEEVVVSRYKNDHPEIAYWQVENEPFLDFGICAPVDNADLVDSEIAKVKSIDASRPILVTDSGELSLWVNAAKRGDIFGTTMYREVYTERFGHWRYPIGPNFFKLKRLIIQLFAKQDNAIVIELQGEPWLRGWTTSFPVEDQLASMDAQTLNDNVEFAKKTGMREIYVWGVEWWYWMKTAKDNPTLWDQAKNIYTVQ